MRLVTIADLKQDTSTKGLLIDRAMQLGRWYGEFKAADTNAYKYEVDVGGERARPPGIHASEISRCQRQLTYSIQGEERRSVSTEHGNTNMRLRFALGHAIHAMVQNDFERMCARFNGAITFEREIRINPSLGGNASKWGAYSSMDGCFTFWHDNEPYLRVGLEIKTKSGPEYDKLVKPDEDHLEQVNLYQAALDLPLMWLFYYNKSNSNWTNSEPPYLFQFDQRLWESELEPRFADSHQHAAAGTLPPRQEGMYCRWCPFAWTCQPSIFTAKSAWEPSTTAYKPGAIRR